MISIEIYTFAASCMVTFMIQDIVAAIPLGIIMAFLFGPVFFVLLETAALKGTRGAIIFDIGVILSDLIFLLIAYFSTSTLLKSIKDEPGLFIFGGVILMTYGIISFVKEKRNGDCQEQEELCTLQKIKKSDWVGLFAKGFLLNFINIGVLGFWLGIIVAFGPTMDMEPSRLGVFFSSVLITYFIIDLLKINLAKKLTKKLTPLVVTKFKRVISVIIVLCGVVLAARGVFPGKMEQVQKKVEDAMPEMSIIKEPTNSFEKVSH